MQTLFDTICAVITPPGHSAVAMLRISGNRSIEIVCRFFSNHAKLQKAASHTMHYGTFRDNAGTAIDDVVCLLYRAPHSYTGEDSIEISCHGNPLIANRILGTLLGHARMATAGEFTRRAFLNGKMDLTQAEAVADVISATTIKSELAALMQIKGYLATELKNLLQRITTARIKMELAIDFSDQDLPQIDLDTQRTQIAAILNDMELLGSEGGKYIRDGIRICLAGAPNLGKSSIFNALLKENRAIVTPHPGTTRDYIEETIALDGYPVVVYDTAGIRNTVDEIEQMGITRTHDLMQSADIILYLLDQDSSYEFSPDFNEERMIWVWNKIDLAGFNGLPSQEDWERYLMSLQLRLPHEVDDEPIVMNIIPCSTVLPDGLTALTDAILSKLSLPRDIENRPLITNTRHLAALQRSRTAIQAALQAMDCDAGYEFVAFDLIEASSALEEILGVISTDDLLDSIFTNFCIGK
ncbi:MAG: tRNA uridine-5-carboxymethylaminomethyl(34) synthesis GTPase MnmE [Candidatus Cloacimonetes bacterium HGW-Cloacimonetes-1]|jgi:tRNA modification GTPase|nr:MAG: tRNA uridine-5-carboxymethylaminomethyl(34) synthesis GTPase MnmE [Candidatus Cloacimonetes bacterium HGW-Cloacimonetes-1]